MTRRIRISARLFVDTWWNHALELSLPGTRQETRHRRSLLEHQDPVPPAVWAPEEPRQINPPAAIPAPNPVLEAEHR